MKAVSALAISGAFIDQPWYNKGILENGPRGTGYGWALVHKMAWGLQKPWIPNLDFIRASE